MGEFEAGSQKSPLQLGVTFRTGLLKNKVAKTQVRKYLKKLQPKFDPKTQGTYVSELLFCKNR